MKKNDVGCGDIDILIKSDSLVWNKLILKMSALMKPKQIFHLGAGVCGGRIGQGLQVANERTEEKDERPALVRVLRRAWYIVPWVSPFKRYHWV